MHGPIDYIIVGFEGSKFDGSILRAIADAVDKGIIDIVALSFIQKDAEGTVNTLDIDGLGDDYVVEFTQNTQPGMTRCHRMTSTRWLIYWSPIPAPVCW